MLYSGLTNIRDCIAFPKTAKGTDLMTAPPEESIRGSSRNCISRVISSSPVLRGYSPKGTFRWATDL